MHGDGRVDQIAAQVLGAAPSAILVGAGEPAVADHIRDQDRRDLPGSRHGAPSPAMQNSTRRPRAARRPIESDRAKGGGISNRRGAFSGGAKAPPRMRYGYELQCPAQTHRHGLTTGARARS